MSSTILHKRNDTPGNTPLLSSLSAGELAMNVSDGKLFIKTTNNAIRSFSNDSQVPYILNQTLSSVNFQYGNNVVSQSFGAALGGYNNDISGAGSTTVNGEDNDIAGDFAFIGSGYKNKITAAGDYSAILAGSNNLISHPNSFAIGSNLSSHSADFTYVNNISASGILYGDGSGLTQVASMVMTAQVKNADTVTLTRGTVVYTFGAAGDVMTVKRASSAGDPTSSKTLGLINETIAPNQIGSATLAGRMELLSLAPPYADGDILWLGNTPGTFTRTKPVAPEHGVYLGVVERANSGNGIAYIKVQNGYELNEIHDVLVNGVQAGDVLQRNSANTLWVSAPLSSNNWNSVYSNVRTNSATNWDNALSNQYTHSNFLPLTGGTITGNTVVNNNLTIFGNLSCSGTQTFANTIFSTTSALSVVHVGSGPAMWVGNNGTGDIASFYDIDENVEVLHVGGINSAYPNVGIKVSDPNKTLTVNGEISANNTIWDAAGNSNQWNSVFSNVQSNSANSDSVYNSVKAVSGNWDSTYSTVQANSAANWNYQGTDLKDLSANWQQTYTDVSLMSATWNSVYSNVQANSATWNIDSTIDTGVRAVTANWDSTYTTIQTNSANWDAAYSSAGADLSVRALTGSWDSTYTVVQTNSSIWDSVYSSVNSISGNWNSVYSSVGSTSANWDSAYSYVAANSVNLTATNITVTNDLTVADTVSAKFYQGTLIDWMTLVRGYKTTPTLLQTIAGGDVYTYVFATAGADQTYYRYIATDGSEDAFYGTFSGGVLSNLITTKKIIL